ncbi:MAG: ATP-binding cassette domain-containing protein [Gemmatimonadales bacterium]
MIRLVDVYKAFGNKRILTGFSLDIPDGKATVLLGYSGTGKSVTLKLIAGLFMPDAGLVEVDGQALSALDAAGLQAVRARIGYVFQFAALFDSMSVEDNIRLGLKRQGLDEDEMRARVTESLALVEMAGTEARFPAELSGGMRKRVGIARAIALKPHYILYDEPTTGLDPVTSAVIDQLMIRTSRELGVTSVVVTHDMRSAYAVGDRIALLYEGALRQVGTVAEIQETTDPIVRQFIEGRPNAEVATP